MPKTAKLSSRKIIKKKSSICEIKFLWNSFSFPGSTFQFKKKKSQIFFRNLMNAKINSPEIYVSPLKLWNCKIKFPRKKSFRSSAKFSYLKVIARISQALWTTKPKNFYHPNQFSIRCIVKSFNSWSTVPLGVVVQIQRG